MQCSVCLEHRAVVDLAGCGHTICTDCARELVAVQAAGDLSRYPLRCFVHGCGSAVANTTLKSAGVLRTPAEWTKHHRFGVLATARDSSDQRAAHCPACDAPQLVNAGAKGWQTRRCRAPGCAGGSFEVAPVDNEDKATFWFLTAAHKTDFGGRDDGWRRCPGCKMVISKGDGCNHMTCVCGHSFNWDEGKVRGARH